MLTKEQIAQCIDSTVLKPTATFEDVDRLCKEAIKYGFYAVCVNPCYVSQAVNNLKGSNVKVATVVGFPLGAVTTESKVFEAVQAVKAGAEEVDMVINLGLLKSGDFFGTQQDISQVVNKVKEINPKAKVKVILEMAHLDENEKVSACQLAKDAKVDFVKTSTGFGPGGATVEDVKLMRKIVGETIGVKASGGIKDAKTAIEMIKAGANRIGTSSAVAIVNGLSDL